MFVHYNQLDCFVLFFNNYILFCYSDMVAKMSKDKGVIRDFINAIMDNKLGSKNDVHLLVLEESNKVVSHSAADPQSYIFATTMVDNLDAFKGWKKFDNKLSMEVFTSQLKKVDNIEHVSFADSVPLQTASYTATMAHNATVGVGNMMAAEDTIAEVEAVEVAADAELCEKLQEPGKNASNVAVPAASIPKSTVAAYKLPNPAAGLQAFDCSKLSFSFGKDGKGSGQPRGCEFAIGYAFPHKIHPYCVLMGILKKINTNVWHLGSGFYETLFQQFVEQLESQGLDVPLFMTTVRDIAICDQSNPAVYKRNKSGYTQNRVFFLMRVPNGFGVEAVVKQTMNTFSSPFKESAKNCGMEYANWLAANKAGAYNSATGETGRSKKITHDEFAKQMQVKLVNGFSKCTPEYNVALNKWMTYWDIKTMLVEHLGYTGWDDVPKDAKKYVISQYPRVKFPDWESIEKDEY